MINKIIFSALTVFIFSCNNDSQNKINELKNQNDSLRTILNILNNKYVFDSIAIRNIYSDNNTYKKGSLVSGEIVIIGYNNNDDDNISVILGDSIKYNPQLNIYNPDTLKLHNGGFKYSKKLNNDLLPIWGLINVDNKYGKKSSFYNLNTFISKN